MKRIVGIILLGIVLFTMQACNTLKGAGRDIERTGEELDEKL